MHQHRQSAIMFSDIAGFTALMEKDEESALKLLHRNLNIHQSIIKHYKGKLLKEMGDGILASFDTSSAAVKCASAIQSMAKKEGIALRIGIDEGEVVFKEGDVFGSGVNIASRLQTNADPGQIHISHAVYRDIKNKDGIKTEFVGEKTFKNVDELIKVYQAEALIKQKMTEVENPPKYLLARKSSKYLIAAMLIIIISGILIWQIPSKTDSIINSNIDTNEKSIAILPFDNLSEVEENEHFAVGLVDDLLNRISVIKELKVISRTSSDVYRERGVKRTPDIARELGATHIVEGSVQRYGNKVRIMVQLINAMNDDQIWSDTYDHELVDIFRTQSEIALEITSKLKPILSSEERNQIQETKTKNVKAFELYQLGRFHWNKRTGEGYRKSIEYFKKAMEEDTSYGLAYAGLADTYHLMAMRQLIDKQLGRDSAVELAFKALQLDEHLAEAYTVLGSLYDYIDWEWEKAEKALKRALELNPNYSTAHLYYFDYLIITGKHKEARKHIDKAIELDPLSFIIRWSSAKLYYHRGRFQEALAENQRAKELQNDHPWAVSLDYRIYHNLGERDKTIDAFYKVMQLQPQFYNLDSVKIMYEKSDLEGLINYRMRVDEKRSRYYLLARYYGLYGNHEKAIDCLEKAFKSGTISPSFSFNIHFKDLHDNPKYIAIIKKMGLYKYWSDSRKLEL